MGKKKKWEKNLEDLYDELLEENAKLKKENSELGDFVDELTEAGTRMKIAADKLGFDVKDLEKKVKREEKKDKHRRDAYEEALRRTNEDYDFDPIPKTEASNNMFDQIADLIGGMKTALADLNKDDGDEKKTTKEKLLDTIEENLFLGDHGALLDRLTARSDMPLAFAAAVAKDPNVLKLASPFLSKTAGLGLLGMRMPKGLENIGALMMG